MDEKPRKRQGFTSLTPERMKEVASKGGKSAQAKGTGHRFTPEKAKEAGRKGGRIAQARAKERRKEEGQEE